MFIHEILKEVYIHDIVLLCSDRGYPSDGECHTQCGGVHVELGTSVLGIEQEGEVKVQLIEFGASVQLQSILSHLQTHLLGRGLCVCVCVCVCACVSVCVRVCVRMHTITIYCYDYKLR